MRRVFLLLALMEANFSLLNSLRDAEIRRVWKGIHYTQANSVKRFDLPLVENHSKLKEGIEDGSIWLGLFCAIPTKC
jgi:hypothetical protein